MTTDELLQLIAANAQAIAENTRQAEQRDTVFQARMDELARQAAQRDIAFQARMDALTQSIDQVSQTSQARIDENARQAEQRDTAFRARMNEFTEQRERDEQDWRNDRADIQTRFTDVTGLVASLVEVAQITIARIDRMQDEVTTLQGQTQDTINQVRDLQVLGNRMMERLERLDGE